MFSTNNFFPARLAFLVATTAAAFVAVPASAQTAPETMAIGATVANNCTLTTTPVAFGSIDVIAGAAVNGTGGLGVTCTTGAAWSAVASIGAGTGATTAVRKMTAGANVLNYALYTDTARTIVWGDGATGAALTGTGTGALDSQIIYASVLPTQNLVPAGTYGDTVTVTITY